MNVLIWLIRWALDGDGVPGIFERGRKDRMTIALLEMKCSLNKV
jgi:hypothetical protein